MRRAPPSPIPDPPPVPEGRGVRVGGRPRFPWYPDPEAEPLAEPDPDPESRAPASPRSPRSRRPEPRPEDPGLSPALPLPLEPGRPPAPELFRWGPFPVGRPDAVRPPDAPPRGRGEPEGVGAAMATIVTAPRGATMPPPKRGHCLEKSRRRPTLPGGYPPSTIGAGGLNCRVRNGNGCLSAAMATGNCALSGARGPPPRAGRRPSPA